MEREWNFKTPFRDRLLTQRPPRSPRHAFITVLMHPPVHNLESHTTRIGHCRGHGYLVALLAAQGLCEEFKHVGTLSHLDTLSHARTHTHTHTHTHTAFDVMKQHKADTRMAYRSRAPPPHHHHHHHHHTHTQCSRAPRAFVACRLHRVRDVANFLLAPRSRKRETFCVGHSGTSLRVWRATGPGGVAGLNQPPRARTRRV